MNKLRHRSHNSGSNTNPETHTNEDSSLLLPTTSRTRYSSNKPKASLGPFLLELARHQWSIMKPLRRFWFSIALVFISFYVLLGIVDILGHCYGPSRSIEQEPVGISSSTFFAVAINTYKRQDMLRDAVRHYADTCGRTYGVGQVFVLWAEQHAKPPGNTDSFFASSSGFRGDSRLGRSLNRATVHVIQLPKDSLNARFLPIDGLEGNGVFMVDDDIRVSCPSLRHGFQAWEAFPDAMVGFYPRLASPPRNSRVPTSNSLVYYSWPTVFFAQKFNLVLTKACFLHQKYLEIYSSQRHPQAIRDYVDEHRNCEDIAMSMLVANITKAASKTVAFPIYMEGTVSDKGLFGGISTGAGHMTTRSACLENLTRIYTERGWDPPLSLDAPLAMHSWLHHAPGYWWQSRPSNVFEWFAIENFFI